MVKQLFILGTGFIGGSVLAALLEQKKSEYEFAALCRDEKKADKLKELGVRPVMGSLHDDEVISKEVEKADVVLHIATADDLPSVQSIIKGLSARPASKEPAIYIHTSGTGVFTIPEHPDDTVFNDKNPEQFDKLLDEEKSPHRKEDMAIKRAVDSGKLNAKVSIILPPTIFGVGSGPFNTISIQIPGWIKEVKGKKFTVWGGQRRWQNIHIKNLVTAYLTLLAHLENTTTTSPPLYVIAETGEHYWKDVGARLQKELSARKLITDEEPEVISDANYDLETGTQSRAKSEWLHEWGWKVDETLPSVFDSIPEEIEEMQRVGQI
ncbi:hypothetical protein JCM8547_004769 [Rhodosporidiobolus lusitaniae]